MPEQLWQLFEKQVGIFDKKFHYKRSNRWQSDDQRMNGNTHERIQVRHVRRRIPKADTSTTVVFEAYF